ncbi:hypothetical protein LX36DRAFT_71041 [Colletotrichum falcatum]|nr:hypothetical protein LX36DRAFT_71041 [Colletotrichum falcatum]
MLLLMEQDGNEGFSRGPGQAQPARRQGGVNVGSETRSPGRWVTGPRKVAAGIVKRHVSRSEFFFPLGQSDASEPTKGPPRRQAYAGGFEILRLWPRASSYLDLDGECSNTVCPCPVQVLPPRGGTVHSPTARYWSLDQRMQIPHAALVFSWRQVKVVRAGLQFWGLESSTATRVDRANAPRMEMPSCREVGGV